MGLWTRSGSRDRSDPDVAIKAYRGTIVTCRPSWRRSRVTSSARRSSSPTRHRPLSRRLDRCDRVIQNESRDPFGGNVYCVTMQITFFTRKFRNGERNLHCDVVHITTKWVSSLTLDCNGVFAIKAYCDYDDAGFADGLATRSLRKLLYTNRYAAPPKRHQKCYRTEDRSRSSSILLCPILTTSLTVQSERSS